MDLLKLFVESYVQLIGHIAWPVAISVILFIFRKPLIVKLQGLIKAGTGKTYFEFEKFELQEIIAKKKLKFAEITKESFTWNNYLDALEQWAVWISWFADERLLGYIREGRSPDDFTMLKFAISQFKMVLKIIRKERPDSGFLKSFEDSLRNTETQFEKYKSLFPKTKKNSRASLV